MFWFSWKEIARIIPFFDLGGAPRHNYDHLVEGSGPSLRSQKYRLSPWIDLSCCFRFEFQYSRLAWCCADFSPHPERFLYQVSGD
jgi:hypothetical protein